MKRFLSYVLIFLISISAPLTAQEDEESGGFLVDLLENNLSGENRYIKVSGLEGALSARATISEITVSDDSGVWLTVTDAVLDWNRLALVRGRFSVNTLSAGEINIARNPTPTVATENLPTPEATPFQVPELPVSIEIGEMRIDKVVLGEPVIGRAAELSLNGSIGLADGTLDTKLAISRLDRPTDDLNLIAGFDNETRLISLDLKLAEDQGGLVSEILQIPERPSILLTANGQGPVHDFTADIALASNDVERMGGQVRLRSETTSAADDASQSGIAFSADLAGDITPLLAPDYREFFGSDLQLTLAGRSGPDGSLAVQNFDLQSNALVLNGGVDIAGNGKVETLLVQGRIAPPNGTKVVLPMGEPRTELRSATVSARLEAEKDNTWDLRLNVNGLNRPDMSIENAEVVADGTFDQQDGMRLAGSVQSNVDGLTFADDALNQALGSDITLSGDFEAVNETAMKLRKIKMVGDSYSADLEADIDGLNSGFRVDGHAQVTATDLSRFSALSGQEIGGSASGTLSGTGAPLGGTFAFDLDAQTQDLTVGIEQVDPLVTGKTTIKLQASRSETGLEIQSFALDGTALTAQAQGAVRSGATNLEFDAQLDDLARVVPQMPGPLTLTGDVSQTANEIVGQVRLDGPDDSFADLRGNIEKNGDIDLAYDATLNRIERFLPQFPGTATATGTAKHDGKTWQLATNANGPAGITVVANGAIDDAEQILLDVKLAEPAGGPVSEFLKIPGHPSLLLTAKGSGPVSDFSAEILLASDETERLAGNVRLKNEPAPDSNDQTPPALGFNANLEGDVAPLLAEDFRRFFGDETQLQVSGRSDPDGRLTLHNLDVISDALILNGALDIAGSGLIENAFLQGRIAPAEGSEVTLPVPGPRTSVQAAMIDARLESDKGNSWALRLGLDGLSRPDISFARAEFDASGTLDQLDNMHLDGSLNTVFRGIALADSALTQAVGTQVRLKTDFELTDASELAIRNLKASGVDYSAGADVEISGLNDNMRVSGDAAIVATNLTRLSGLAGRRVGGSIAAEMSGAADVSGETFDATLNVEATDLSSGIEKFDALITGLTRLDLTVERSLSGLDIKSFRLDGTALSANANGTLQKSAANFDFHAKLDDLARVLPDVPGPLTITGDVSQSEDVINGEARIDGPTGSFADLTAIIDPDGTIELGYDAKISRMERFMPEFPGEVSAKGTARKSGDVWQIDSDAKGPADISAEISGTVDQSTLESDVTAVGQLQLAAVNRFIAPNSIRGLAKFDLALNGPPELNGLTGTVSTANTSVAIPSIVQTIDDLDADVSLANGRADLSVTAGLRAGGQVKVSGPVSLTPPFDASLVAAIQELVLTDNVTFDSSANGQLAYSGALAGNGSVSGEILFGETNINLSAMSGSLGAAPIPPIKHRGEPGAVHATRDRAGLVDTGSGGAGPDIALDVRLAANNKVFVRGRGLQAELGGDILIRGSTAQVAPAGQVELVRGNLDILGRRLRLTKGLVTLQGKLEPYMEFAATTSTSDGVATLEIAGPMTAPKVTVYSDPERPSEEALAMLVFGNQYSELSPLKIAQLAASLAQLSGSGDGATEKAREGLGVDTLDVGTDDDGKAQFGAGKYIADGVYTDFSVNTQGDTELNLNLDVTNNLTLKGTVDNSGDTALGVFFERDY